MRFIFDPSKEPSKFLTQAYIAALLVIAVLALGSHLIIVHVNNSQKETSEVVYIAGRQRVTALQIGLHAANYNRLGREADKNRLENAIFSFHIGHRYLTQGKAGDAMEEALPPADAQIMKLEMPPEKIDKNFEMSPALHHMYFEEPLNLDIQVKEYIEAAKTYASYEFDDQSEERKQAFEKIINMAMGPLINSLDQTAQRYQVEALLVIDRLSDIQFGVFVFLLITLVLEAVFIFRPLVLHVHNYSQQLIKLALYDSLTGLRNRRAFMRFAKAELSRAKRHDEPFCLVLLDIDKFKAVNDTYGHTVGDKVLQHFSDILKHSLREEDIISRVGGEEFCLLLPSTDIKTGEPLIDRLRQKIEKTPCSLDDGADLSYTSSFGIVEYKGGEATLEELYKLADDALYKAKEGGRNRVVVSEGYSPADEAQNQVAFKAADA